MRVLYLTNVPAPYRVSFFNEWGQYCDLTVLFEKRTSDERDKSWSNYTFENFKGIFLKGKAINTDTAICFEVIKYIKSEKYDKIICDNFSSPTGIIAIEYMRLLGRRFYLESDGGFPKGGKGFKEKFKKHIISGAEGYFSTANELDKYYLQYGAKSERIFRYPFTSLKKKDIVLDIVIKGEKLEVRKKLNICEEKIVLAVGQFIHRKGFDLLIKAAAELPRNIGFYFVGGEPTAEYIELKNNFGLNNVHFIGFKSKKDLAEYYKASDLFVLPTREDIWGLVINEAMANGLPVITTNRCVAGLELVKDGENGYIIDVDDIEALSDKIKTILFDVDITAFSKRSLEIVNEYTIENMVKRHIEILEKSERNKNAKTK